MAARRSTAAVARVLVVLRPVDEARRRRRRWHDCAPAGSDHRAVAAPRAAGGWRGAASASYRECSARGKDDAGRSGRHTLIVWSHEHEANASFSTRFQSTPATSAWCSQKTATGRPPVGATTSNSLTLPSPLAATSWCSCASLHATSYSPSFVSKRPSGCSASPPPGALTTSTTTSRPLPTMPKFAAVATPSRPGSYGENERPCPRIAGRARLREVAGSSAIAARFARRCDCATGAAISARGQIVHSHRHPLRGARGAHPPRRRAFTSTRGTCSGRTAPRRPRRPRRCSRSRA